ncbi:DUF2934 domain-containing protein [Amaricoccus sp. W119]|uniref:DUF2934 domain-containing protein n=1 Tax=Amaricoccus sp. W119 TaxID=3391833 RepID=UPI0039A573D5
MWTSSGQTHEEIERVAHAIWEAEGRPEGCDREHWMRARELLESGRAESLYPGSTSGRGPASDSGAADERGDMPGPRDPAPIPPTNSEGYVALESREDVAAGAMVEAADAPGAAIRAKANRERL